jgi:hypothetical protein
MSPKGGRRPPSSSGSRKPPPDGISELPLASGRITGRETPGRGRQRSARDRPKSSRSNLSSDGAHSDSDAVSSNDEGGTATTMGSPKHSSLFATNPYAAPGQNRYNNRQQNATATTDDNVLVTKEQVGAVFLARASWSGFDRYGPR